MAGGGFDNDLKKRQQRKTIAATASAAILILLVVGTVAFIATESGDEAKVSTHDMHSSAKSVDMLCSSTDYPNTCISTLTKTLKSKYNDSESVEDPKDLLNAALHVVSSEVGKAFNGSKLFKSNDPRIRGAVEDCKQLFDECMYNIERSMNKSIQFGNNWSHDIETWASAVISFEQSCIDGFPDEESKRKMEMMMKTSKEVASNAVAIVGQVAGLLTLLGDQESKSDQRQLLENATGYSVWLSKSKRRSILGDYQSKLKPNVTVAKDGSGNFTTISAALAAIPEKYEGRYVIYVKKGVYEETVHVEKRMVNVTMYGDGSSKSIITSSKNIVDSKRMWLTATTSVSGDGFIGIDLGFHNTAGPEKNIAVALHVLADKSIFLSCSMEGYQGTLHAQAYRQFYRNCVIKGTVDFIFGDAAAVFQQCVFLIRHPLPSQSTTLTAQARSDGQQTTGFVLHRCKILPDPSLHSDDGIYGWNNYLGRPWKKFSRLVIMESHIGGIVHPEGYTPLEGAKDGRQSTLFYAEYRNIGGSSNLSKRVQWPGVRAVGSKEAKRFTVGRFLHGSSWIQSIGVPVELGLYRHVV